MCGGYGGGVTPVPIPNTEVKPACADGTWGEIPWESRSPPHLLLLDPRLRPGVEPRLGYPRTTSGKKATNMAEADNVRRPRRPDAPAEQRDDRDKRRARDGSNDGTGSRP